MPHSKRLLLPLATATATLLIAGTAHAEVRRSAQSLPSLAHFSSPASTPLRTAMPAKVDRDRGDHGHFDNRRFDHDRDDYERRKDREGHKFEHRDHEHDDSPGC